MSWIICSNQSTKREQKHCANGNNRSVSWLRNSTSQFFKFSIAAFLGTILLSGGFLPAQASIRDEARAPQKTKSALPFGVFGSLEFVTNAEAGTDQWHRVQKRIASERQLYEACDAGKKSCPAYLAKWRNNLHDWKKLTKASQLELVNAWVNSTIHYTDDQVVFDRADYWASPAESLKGRGDCEDYAIAKYASLKALGFGEDKLRIVIVNDTRKNLGHAVLSVSTDDGLYILDNQNRLPVIHQKISYYQPLYSMNAGGHWLNIATRQIKSQYNNAAVAEKDPAQNSKPVAVETVAAGQASATPMLRPSFAEAELAPVQTITAPSTKDEAQDRR